MGKRVCEEVDRVDARGGDKTLDSALLAATWIKWAIGLGSYSGTRYL